MGHVTRLTSSIHADALQPASLKDDPMSHASAALLVEGVCEGEARGWGKHCAFRERVSRGDGIYSGRTSPSLSLPCLRMLPSSMPNCARLFACACACSDVSMLVTLLRYASTQMSICTPCLFIWTGACMQGCDCSGHSCEHARSAHSNASPPFAHTSECRACLCTSTSTACCCLHAYPRGTMHAHLAHVHAREHSTCCCRPHAQA